MSMETSVFGAIRPPSGSCDDRGKWLKREPEPEPEPDSDSEAEEESESEAEEESEGEEGSESIVKLDLSWWESIPVKDLKESDFARRYDDHPCTFHFACPQFVYKNKAMRKEEEDIKNAVAAYLKTTKNISPFDAIPIPHAANTCGNNFPRPFPITKERIPFLTDLSKLALEKCNHDDQGTNIKYEFLELVKATRRPIPIFGNYYITFQAKPKTEDATDAHPSHCPAPTTFQAHVWNSKPEPEVKLCSIKT